MIRFIKLLFSLLMVFTLHVSRGQNTELKNSIEKLQKGMDCLVTFCDTTYHEYGFQGMVYEIILDSTFKSNSQVLESFHIREINYFDEIKNEIADYKYWVYRNRIFLLNKTQGVLFRSYFSDIKNNCIFDWYLSDVGDNIIETSIVMEYKLNQNYPYKISEKKGSRRMSVFPIYIK